MPRKGKSSESAPDAMAMVRRRIPHRTAVPTIPKSVAQETSAVNENGDPGNRPFLNTVLPNRVDNQKNA